jgi:hypothetical protein
MMTNEELKELACEVIDMNGGEFSYRFEYSFYQGNLHLVCWVEHIIFRIWECVSTIEDPEKLIRLIHDATDRINKKIQIKVEGGIYEI